MRRFNDEEFWDFINEIRGLDERESIMLIDPVFTVPQRLELDRLVNGPTAAYAQITMRNNQGNTPPVLVFCRQQDVQFVFEQQREILASAGATNIQFGRAQ